MQLLYSLTPIGQIAQLVEQRTENPCVGGSTPSLSTTNTPPSSPGTPGVFAFRRILVRDAFYDDSRSVNLPNLSVYFPQQYPE